LVVDNNATSVTKEKRGGGGGRSKKTPPCFPPFRMGCIPVPVKLQRTC